MKALLKRLLRPYFRLTANRRGGLRAEVAFWDKWMATGGWKWPDDFKERLLRDRPVAPPIKDLIDQLDQPVIEILDVGAGPLTLLGTVHPTKTIRVTASDPLADEYDRLLRKHRIDPPIRTLLCPGESLVACFGEKRFDIVHARNSVDHAADPLAVIRNMIAVCRPGGFVLLSHEENEADKEGCRGLHQWNFSREGGEFVICGAKSATTVVNDAVAPERFACELRDGHVICRLRRER